MSSISSISSVRRKASFKGASWHVDTSSESYGRRVVNHQFPMRDTPFNEDLGAKTIQVQLSGWLSGENWLAERDALIDACTSFGGGTLIHPFYPTPIRASCTDCTVSHAKDALGRVSVSLTFLEDTAYTGGVTTAFLPVLVQSVVSSAITAATSAFTAAINTTSGEKAFTATANEIRSASILLDEARLLSVVDADIMPTLSRNIEKLYDAAEDIARGDLNPLDYVDPIVDNFRDGISDNNSAARVLLPISEYNQGFVVDTSGSDTTVVASKNTAATARFFRRVFGLLRGEFAANGEYNTKSRAEAAQNNFALWYQTELNQTDPTIDPEFYEAFDRSAGNIIDMFVENHTSNVPSLRLKFSGPQSAVALAARIYGDPTRAEEIWKLSGTPHPSFIGPSVEVRAR